MRPIPRTINLVCALAFTGTGLYLLSRPILDGHVSRRLLVWGGVVVALGAYWLWADFINADPRPEK
jgi:hypothetical protein